MGEQGQGEYRDGLGSYPADGWREVSFREACGYYRLSEKTLRKRLREKVIPGRYRFVNGREEWVVQIPPGEPGEYREGTGNAPASYREPAEPIRGAFREGAGTAPEPYREPPEPVPTREDILSLIREQLSADRAERERLHEENRALTVEVTTLRQALDEQTRALSDGQDAAREEVRALAGRVGEIGTLSRVGRIQAAAALLLALLSAIVSGLSLTARPSGSAKAPTTGSAKGFAPATRPAAPIRLPARLAVGGAGTARGGSTRAAGP